MCRAPRSRRRPASFLAALVAVSLTALGSPPARAHGELFEVLEVLAAGPDGTPTVVHTSVGLAFAKADGRFRYGCPSRWGDDPLALAVSAPTGDRVAVVGGGRAFASADSGCSFSELALPAGAAADTLAWSGDAAWLTTSGADPTLYRVAYDGDAPALAAVASLGDHVATSLVATSGGDAAVLVAGLAPTPWVRAYRADGGFDALPLGLDGVTDLSLRYADADVVWAVAVTAGGRFVLRGEGGELAPVDGPRAQILGPLRTAAGADVAILDYRDATWVDGAFVRTGPSRWSCLDAAGGATFGCVLADLYRLDGGDDPPRVFGLDLLDGPSAGCPGGLPRADVCWFDWFHYGNEAGLTIPSEDPDPPPVAETPGPPATASDAGGCRGGAPALPATALLLLLLASARRRWRRRRGPGIG